MKQYVIMIIINLVIFSNLSSEILNNFNFILKTGEKKCIRIEKKKIKIANVSEAKMFMLGMIKFYQVFISSQDSNVCMFTFSCSRFGVYAIKNYGILWGSFMTLDRLLRCNGLGLSYYEMSLSTRKAIDYPIQLYYLPWNKNEKR